MREMKDSGISTIGAIPKSWDLVRFKYICQVKANTVNPEYYFDYPQVAPDNIQKNTGRLLSFCTVRDSAVISSNNLFFTGQILYSKIRPYLNKVIIAPFDGLCSTDISPIETNQHTKFVLYMMLSSYFVELVSVVIHDRVKIPRINQEELGEIKVVIPNLEEQKAIADFLDAKCEEIDELSDDIQSQIDTLEQYKRSLIFETVTKGLDPNVPMKDTGLKWLGKIPSSWNIGRISSFYTPRNIKVNDTDYQPLSVTNKGVVPQLENVAKTNSHDARKLVRAGDFVINSRSDRRGSCGISQLDGSVSLINTVLSPREEMNPEFFNWLFHTTQFSDEFYKWGHGIVDDLWTTNWQDMKKISIPVPPLSEQNAIASFLNVKCSNIDIALATKREQLNVLADYKKALIFEYVTGKKKVV